MSAARNSSPGLIRPDATSVIVEDSRSGACQLLTVGDPRCDKAFVTKSGRAEISNLPLGSAADEPVESRQTPLETGDLDAAFSYSPALTPWLSASSGVIVLTKHR
jgi:hypothetical protein